MMNNLIQPVVTKGRMQSRGSTRDVLPSLTRSERLAALIGNLSRGVLFGLGLFVTLLLVAPPVATANVLHHWTFDSGDVSATMAFDVVGGNTATLVNASGNAMFVAAGGAFNGYFREPANDDQATLASVVSFPNGTEWSVALWINRAGSNPANPNIISPIGNNASNDEQIRLRRNQDTSLTWVGTSGNEVRGSVGSGVLPADAWVQIVAVSDGVTVTLYRDGVALTPQLSTVTDTGWMFNSIGKGKLSPGQSQGADIDEVWVFDKALTKKEVERLREFNTFVTIISSPIPTLSEWGLLAMAGVLGIVGFMVIRRRKASA